MEVDVPQAPNGHSSELRVNGLLLHPVLPQDEGEGLPYAPIDWPNPGDTWGWRVGKRTAISGYYLDRYLYLPSRLQKSRRGRDGFASKLSVEQYIQARFPGTDIEAFFASFSWKVPSKQTFLIKEHQASSCMLSEELAEASLSDCHTGRPSCKAGNSSCPSLTEEEKVSSVTSTMFCDICCSEPSFCRECCCILCCKTIDFAFGGYSFMRCQSKVHDGLICAHAAHLTCALRSYLAGAVPGSIALDAQYYCRRCDSRTELVEHVTKVLKICESVDSPEDIKKMLNIVICLLRGSQRRDAKRLLNRAQLVLQKFESGNVSDVWILEDDISGVRKDMVSSKYLKKATKGKAASSSRTVTEIASPGLATKEKIVPPSKSKDVVLAESPKKAVSEERMDRKQDPAAQKKEANKQKIAETATVPATAVPSSSVVLVTGLPPPNISLPRTFDQIDVQRTKAYTSLGPSPSDLRKLTIPDSVCVEEKRWLASLPAEVLHHETVKFFEMARLGLYATTAYCCALEKKCHSMEGTSLSKSQLTIAQELVQKVQQERDQLQKEKEDLLKELKAKSEAIAEKDKAIATKNQELKTCNGLMIEMREKIKTLRADAKDREEGWQKEREELGQQVAEGERKLCDFFKSEDFKLKVGESILPHWEQGVRIGVRQAVKAFGDLDPKIAYFEPDYDDMCGEPDIEDSDEEVESRERDDKDEKMFFDEEAVEETKDDALANVGDSKEQA